MGVAFHILTSFIDLAAFRNSLIIRNRVLFAPVKNFGGQVANLVKIQEGKVIFTVIYIVTFSFPFVCQVLL